MNFKFGEVNYIKMLGLRNGTKSDNRPITDERVEEEYKKKKIELEKISRGVRPQDMEYLENLRKAIEDSYEVLKTEEGRKKYEEFLKVQDKARKEQETINKIEKEIPQNIKIPKTPEKITREEYERRQAYYERVLNTTKEAAKKAEEINGIKYIPIRKGKFIKETPDSKNNGDER